MDPWIKTLADVGLPGVVLFILLKWVVPKLDRLFERMGDLGATLTLLISSMPDIKRRSKDEAERLRGKFLTEASDGEK